MPGIALLAGAEADSTRLLAALRTLRLPHYQYGLIGVDAGLVAGWAGHAGYPIEVIRFPDGWAALEGAIYGSAPDVVVAAVKRLGHTFSVNPTEGRDAAERWAASVDGDFLLVLGAPKRKRLLVVGDPLGRLGVFVRRTAHRVALAREIGFFRALGDRMDADRLAYAQVLAIGWPLGNRTLLDGVVRVAPGSSLLVDLETSEVSQRTYHQWDFEGMQQSRRSFKQCLDEVVPAFVETCAAQARWAQGRPLVVSLSGGLDSRAVAAGFKCANADQTTVTFRDAVGDNESDVAIAEKIASVLGVPWRRFQLDSPSWEERERLIALREGLNYIGASHMLQFLEHLRDALGIQACYITGDGGDRILPDLRPDRRLRNMSDLLEFRFASPVWCPRAAAALVGIRESELRESVRSELGSYPERSMEYRALRFQVMERGLHFLLEGEERNRAIIWSMTPFYVQSFFRAASSVPSRLKVSHRFYSAFLHALSAPSAAVHNAEWHAAPGSPKARVRALLQKAFRSLPYSLREALRARFLSKSHDAPATEDFRGRLVGLAKDPAVLAVFRKDALDGVALEGCSRYQTDVLASLMIYSRLSSNVREALIGAHEDGKHEQKIQSASQLHN